MQDLELTDLNDYLHTRGGVDAEGGKLDIYAEFATTDGRTEGYVKTLFEDMRILGFRDIRDPTDALAALWEGLVQLAAVVLENQPYDRLATRVPLRGTNRATTADVWATVGGLLRNAFLAAIGPTIEDSIELQDMEIVVPKAGAKGAPAPATETSRAGSPPAGDRSANEPSSDRPQPPPNGPQEPPR